jgi:hypothetical protein
MPEDTDGMFEAGDIAIFKEDDSIMEVLVVENTSNKKWIRYKLEIKRIVHPSRIYKMGKIGDQFEVDKVRGYEGIEMWKLYEQGYFG